MTKQKRCVICKKELTYHQKFTCSPKCYGKKRKQEGTIRREKRILITLKQTKKWATARYIKDRAGNMDYDAFKETFKKFENKKLVDTIDTIRGKMYLLKNKFRK